MSEPQDSAPEPVPNLAGFVLDLEKSLAPSWVKESGSGAAKYKDYAFDAGPARDSHRGGNRDRKGGDRRQRDKSFAGKGSGKPERRDSRGPNKRGESEARFRERPAREHSEAPQITGWNVVFLPEERGLEGLVRQIRSTLRAFPLFDLARLVLGAPNRYTLQWKKQGGPSLWICKADSTVWTTHEAAVDHALQNHSEQFYTTRSVETEAPKGNFSVVARCGITGVLLGPPNHHGYQSSLVRHHREKLSSMPYERFLSRVETVREEALIEQWKASLSQVQEWIPTGEAEGEPTHEPIRDAAQRRAHFLQHHSAAIIEELPDGSVIPGNAVADGDRAVSGFIRSLWDALQRFPLPLANILGRRLGESGLQIFKMHNNITYAGPARPRFLDRNNNSVSSGISAILNSLTENRTAPRAVQWEKLLSLPAPSTSTPPPANSGGAPWFVADLMWLLREGYVVDFHGKNLDVSQKAEKRPAAPMQSRAPSE